MKNELIVRGTMLLTLITLFISISFIFFDFRLKGNSELELSYQDKYKEEGYIAKILFCDLSKYVNITNNIVDGKIGNYKINYQLKLGVLSFKLERKVNIIDDIKPIITLKGESKTYICPNKKYKEEGYSAIDDYDGDLTDNVITILNDTSIKYKVSDFSNNSRVVERQIIKKDDEKPIIKLSGGSTIYLKKGEEYKEYGFIANDNCDGNITSNVKIEGVVDVNTVGEYTLNYSVTDSNKNTTTVSRKVIVNEDKTTIDKGIPGVIYLTFDDGPSNDTTEKILDVLKKYDVQATFFITKNGSDDLIKRINDEGHTVALHTYTHDYKSIYSSVDDYFLDLTKIQERVKNVIGKTVTIIRFPGGSNNTISNKYNKGIMQTLREEVEKRGFTYFDWNVDSNDAWSCAKKNVSDKRTCVYNNVTNNLKKSRPNVVLMHDIKPYTAEAIEDIIKYANDKGYVFLKIDDTTSQVKFK